MKHFICSNIHYTLCTIFFHYPVLALTFSHGKSYHEPLIPSDYSPQCLVISTSIGNVIHVVFHTDWHLSLMWMRLQLMSNSNASLLYLCKY